MYWGLSDPKYRNAADFVWRIKPKSERPKARFGLLYVFVRLLYS